MTWTFPTAPARSAAPAPGTAITALIVGLAAAAIILSQVGMLLLSRSPSSPILWQLYFEVGRPLDLFYQLSSMLLGDIGLPAFTVLVAAAAAICLGAVLSGRRLLQALAYHALVGVAAILCYGSAGVHDVAVLTLSAQSSRTVAVVAILFGLFPLLQCFRIHREYFAVAARTPSPGRHGRELSAERILRRAWQAISYRRSVKLVDA
jgi:hypothetical protein